MLTRSPYSALAAARELYVRQVRELAELFGYETRNKYVIATPDQRQVAYAAEQQKGVLGFLVRQVFGHWRSFEIHFFGPDRRMLFKAVHPFRFFFQRLEVSTPEGRRIGALQQRWALFGKSFDVLGPDGSRWFSMRSGLFSFWTFPFYSRGTEQARIEKRWSGGLTELFTDKDNFRVSFLNSSLTEEERALILAAAIFVDLQYFEKKAR